MPIEETPAAEAAVVEPIEPDEKENPLWNKPLKDVKQMWENKEITGEQANDYISINVLKQKGLVSMSQEQVAYAFERNHITKTQASAYIQMNKKTDPKDDANVGEGAYILSQLASGRSIEAVLKDTLGLERPSYGPDDLAADFFTGGVWSIMRTTGKVGVKTIGKYAARDMAIGAGVGAGMATASALGAGPVVEMLTGFMTPLGAMAFMKMSKSMLTNFVKHAEHSNPDLLAKLREAHLANPDDPQLSRVMNIVAEGEIVTKKFPDFITGPEIADSVKRNFTNTELYKIHRDALAEADIQSEIFKKSKYKDTVAEAEVGRLQQRNNGAREVLELNYKEATGAKSIETEPFNKWIKKTLADEELIIKSKPMSEAAEDIQRSENVFLKNKDTGELEITADLASRFEKSGLEGAELLELIQKEWNMHSQRARGSVSRATDARGAGATLKRLADLTGGKDIDIQKALGFAGQVAAESKQLRTKAKALFQLFTTYQAQVSEMADLKNIRGFDDELRVMQHINNLGSMSQAVIGVRAEYGRGMNMMRSDAESFMKTNWDIKSIPNKTLGEIELAERTKIQDALKHFRKARTPKERINRAKSLQQNPILMGILEFQQAAMLSHWRTQAINILGSSMAFVNRTYAQTAATGIDAWKKADSWRKPFHFETTRFQEMKTMSSGMSSALIELFRLPLKEMSLKTPIKALRAAGTSVESGTLWKTLWTGKGQIDPYVQKWNSDHLAGVIPDIKLKAYSKDPKNIEFLGKVWQWKGTTLPIGTIVRLPFNGLLGGDEIFKTLNFHIERNKLLYRNVYETGPKDWNSVQRRMGTMMDRNNPAYLEIIQKAKQSMRRETFTSDLDSFTRLGEKALNVPYIGPVMKLTTMPFYKVIVNLPKYALQQTPLGAIAKWQRDALSKGGADRYEILARWALGTGILAGSIAMYENGMITGRQPSSQREAWQNKGIMPYAYLREKPDGSKESIDYGKVDPAAFIVGIGADIGQAYDLTAMAHLDPEAEIELEEIVTAWLMVFTEPLLSKTMLTSLKDTVHVITEPERMNMEKWGIKQVEKFIPRAFDMYNEVTGKSEYIYEVKNLMDAWHKKYNTDKARMKRHSVYGTPVKRVDRFAGLLNKMDVSEDPVMSEMMSTGANQVNFPDYITRNKVKVKLTPDERDAMIDVYASLDVRKALLQIVGNPGYQNMKIREEQAAILKRTIGIFRKAAVDIYSSNGRVSEELIRKLHLKSSQMLSIEITPSPDTKVYKMLEFIKQ